MTPLPDTSLSAPVALIRAALATSSSDQISVVPGYDGSGDPIIHDLTAMPHLLVAGSDRASLQQMLHTLLASVLLKETPVTCRLVLIDPTGLEFGIYADIPHLLSPIANAPAEGMQLLRWASTELDARYGQLAAAGVRNIASYAKKRASMPWLPAMPHIVCAVSQYEDLRMLDEGEFDHLVARLAPKARAIGIHLLLGASHPNSIPSLIRANLASRILLPTDSPSEARAVLGAVPATPLPRADEYMFHDGRQTTAAQVAAVVPLHDLEAISDHWRAQGKPCYLPRSAFRAVPDDDRGPPDGDGLYERAVSLVLQHQRASVSWLQRELRIGYNSAARLIEQMEQEGFIALPEAKSVQRVATARGDVEFEAVSTVVEFGAKARPNRLYFEHPRKINPWPQQETIKRSYTVEEILGFVESSIPANDEPRSAFLAALHEGLVERYPETSPAKSAVSTLPTVAPETYQGLRGPETPPVFVQRVYGEWLGHGLTRAHVRKLDPKLYESINNWLSRPGNEWPADVDLPTLKEQNTRWADRVGKEGIMSAVDGLSGQEAVREARRLVNLRHRRSKEQQQI